MPCLILSFDKKLIDVGRNSSSGYQGFDRSNRVYEKYPPPPDDVSFFVYMALIFVLIFVYVHLR